MKTSFYITTAISYPNGRPHIGHAYEAIATDAIARFHRMMGATVKLVTGTDEHGLKMVQTARATNYDTQTFADEMSIHFRAMYDKLNISYDTFMRTSDPRHHVASIALWKAMAAKGDLYPDRYEGWYSVRDEAFYDESELVDGEGGTRLSPQGTPVEWTAEETWFFRLSEYQEKLLNHYNKHPEFIRPEGRRNEVVRFVEGGLKDLSVSRTSFDWGVKVPGSPEHVMYVWVDALTTYLSGIGYPERAGEFETCWPADIHIIGKDIVRFHAVYWPAFLMSADLPLPRQVFGHGFVLARDGGKMSKSAGNVVDPMRLAERYGVDALRYFLLSEISFGQDGTWSEEAIVTRCNADLANTLGNLVQRTVSMIHKICDGKPPERDELIDKIVAERTAHIAFELRQADADQTRRSLLRQFNEHHDPLDLSRNQMEELRLNGAIEDLMGEVRELNAIIAAREPWKTVKSDPLQAAFDLCLVFTRLQHVVKGFQPFIPETAAKIIALLTVSDIDGRLPKPEPVFPRLEMPVEEVPA
jgi:methionyl-tRNA synthetase